MTYAYTMNRTAVRAIKPGRLRRLLQFFKALFEVREKNPMGVDNATSARLYL